MRTTRTWRRATTYAVCCAVLLITVGDSLIAQTPVPSPPPSSTKLGWSHDGADTTSWMIRVDGQPAVVVTPTRVTDTNDWWIPFPSLTPGEHILYVAACKDIPNFPPACGWSAPFGVVLVVAPTAPANIHVIPPAS